MISAFKERKPWVITTVCLLLDTFTGMLLIGKGRLATAYLVSNIILSALPFIASTYELINIDPVQIWWIPSLFLRLIGAFHSSKIRRRPTDTIANKWYASWHMSFLLSVALPILLALTIRTFLFESFYSASGSMRPTMSTDGNFFVSKIAYKTGDDVKRGDVIVFNTNNKTYIKRVVGLAGDKIQVKAGILHINSAPIVRKHLQVDMTTDDLGRMASFHRYKETFPEGQEHDIYEISDSEALDETAVYSVPDNRYFIMGDNRDQSLDNRIPDEVDFLKPDQIIGKAMYIYWDSKEKKLLWQPVK